MSEPKRAIIIGAGPAGLTAAYELVTRTDIKPIVLEKSQEMGGISRTVKYNGNRMDIGGHPVLFQVRPGDELVDRHHAHAGVRRPHADDHLPAQDAPKSTPRRRAPTPRPKTA